MSLAQKIQEHTRFWRGSGPSLILIPTAQMDLYDTDDYPQRFRDPERMWAAEMRRARPVIDWPTDGIPTVRPNLGVVFVPSIAGLGYAIRPGQMPWPGAPLNREEIRASRRRALADAELMRHASAFYALHRECGGTEIAAYLPDTQGVFDIAHLLSGQDLFTDLFDDAGWVHELLEIALDLYIRVSVHLKHLTGEEDRTMIHGHGTPQGVYFPHAGVRVSEDTCTLLSPAMIRDFVLPFIERAAAPFGGAFVHYCGDHRAFFEQLCRSPLVRAIDLGNSERYDVRWLLERCAESKTVLYSRVSALPDEDWQAYTRRLGRLTAETGARCILRPLVFPEDAGACAAMRHLWHDLTA